MGATADLRGKVAWQLVLMRMGRSGAGQSQLAQESCQGCKCRRGFLAQRVSWWVWQKVLERVCSRIGWGSIFKCCPV